MLKMGNRCQTALWMSKFTLLKDIIRLIHRRKVFHELSNIKTLVASSGNHWTTSHWSLKSAPGKCHHQLSRGEQKPGHWAVCTWGMAVLLLLMGRLPWACLNSQSINVRLPHSSIHDIRESGGLGLCSVTSQAGICNANIFFSGGSMAFLLPLVGHSSPTFEYFLLLFCASLHRLFSMGLGWQK